MPPYRSSSWLFKFDTSRARLASLSLSLSYLLSLNSKPHRRSVQGCCCCAALSFSLLLKRLPFLLFFLTERHVLWHWVEKKKIRVFFVVVIVAVVAWIFSLSLLGSPLDKSYHFIPLDTRTIPTTISNLLLHNTIISAYQRGLFFLPPGCRKTRKITLPFPSPREHVTTQR